MPLGTVRPSRRKRTPSIENTMLIHILQATPVRIWVLLAGLVALGVSQARRRRIGAARAVLLPGLLLVLSLAGVATSFGASATAFGAWAAGTALSLALASRLLPSPRAVWIAATDRFDVAGSWLPLVLILALFLTKYVAGVSFALHPELALDAGVAALCGATYGLFSGVCAARGWQLWRLRARPLAGAALSHG